ncbi:MAG: hypothetical protein ACI86H_002839 [bacterium]|jgi:hypothetical protein
MKNQNQYIKRQIKVFKKQKTSLLTKAFFYTAIVQMMVYVSLFSEYPAIHDYFHELRHALVIVPCH